MDEAYWLSRKRASLKLARSAAGAEARLVHYDLAGRYSLKAMSAQTRANDPAEPARSPGYDVSVVPACKGSFYA